MDKSHLKSRSTALPRGGVAIADPLDTHGQDRSSIPFSIGAARQKAMTKEDMRRHFRYPISASAVVIDPRSKSRLVARASDLGMNGCYLDAMNNSFAVGTPLLVRLSTEGHGFACEARIAYALPGMGMGLTFTRVTSDQAAALNAWIASLSGNAYSTESATDEIITSSAKREYSRDTASTGDQGDAFVELLNILRRKGVLTDSEAEGLRRKAAR